MTTIIDKRQFALEPDDAVRLANLAGPFDAHLRQIELRLGVEINSRGAIFEVIGEADNARIAERVLHEVYAATATESLSPARLNLYLQDSGVEQIAERQAEKSQEVTIKVKRGVIKGRGPNQQRYLHAIATHDVNFGIGPAGTGKTYLAVASAIEALESNRVQRVILTRPAVEAGERLGFLPGDLSQKIDPYLRPLFDALYEMIGFERVAKLIERSVIEIAPLAFMRGRTLNDAFVILDEAQNTTVEQMKMFLTRIGFGSIAVVTGDVTQVDLPRQQTSGLRQAIDILRAVDGISFTFFTSKDVVRHPLVRKIVTAYEDFERASERAAGHGPGGAHDGGVHDGSEPAGSRQMAVQSDDGIDQNPPDEAAGGSASGPAAAGRSFSGG